MNSSWLVYEYVVMGKHVSFQKSEGMNVFKEWVDYFRRKFFTTKDVRFLIFRCSCSVNLLQKVEIAWKRECESWKKLAPYQRIHTFSDSYLHSLS